MHDRLAIEQLVLRIPGLDRDGGKRVAELVTRTLALELTGASEFATLPSLVHVRISSAAGLSHTELAALIARRIIEAVR
jgi:hypothetical protein